MYTYSFDSNGCVLLSADAVYHSPSLAHVMHFCCPHYLVVRHMAAVLIVHSNSVAHCAPQVVQCVAVVAAPSAPPLEMGTFLTEDHLSRRWMSQLGIVALFHVEDDNLVALPHSSNGNGRP